MKKKMISDVDKMTEEKGRFRKHDPDVKTWQHQGNHVTSLKIFDDGLNVVGFDFVMRIDIFKNVRGSFINKGK